MCSTFLFGHLQNGQNSGLRMPKSQKKILMNHQNYQGCLLWCSTQNTDSWLMRILWGLLFSLDFYSMEKKILVWEVTGKIRCCWNHREKNFIKDWWITRISRDVCSPNSIWVPNLSFRVSCAVLHWLAAMSREQLLSPAHNSLSKHLDGDGWGFEGGKGWSAAPESWNIPRFGGEF